MLFLSKRTLSTLAVLAVASVQIFGVHLGYVCEHQCAVVETKVEHCHQVTEAGKIDFGPCTPDSTKDCEEQGSKEHHAEMRVEMKASTAGLAAMSIPPFVGVLIADIQLHEWVLMQALVQSEMMRVPLDTGGDSPPSAAVQVARCMVILV